jgi:hypothetical protein
MSFSLYALACRGIPKTQNPDRGSPDPGRMQSLQSKDGPVLGLHSCSALSPRPCLQFTTNFEYCQEQTMMSEY